MIRSAFSIAGANAVSRLLRFAYLIVISRYLSPDEVGAFLYGMSFYLAFLPFVLLGQPQAMAARLGRSRIGSSRIVGHSLSVHLLAAAALGGCAMLIAWGIETSELFPILALFVLALFGRGLIHWTRGAFVALGDTAWFPRYELVFRLAELAAGTAALVLGGGLVAVCLLHLVFLWLEAGISLIRLSRAAGLDLAVGRDWRLLRRLIATAVPVALGLLLVQLFTQIGTILLRHLQSDLAMIGQFGFAMQFVTALLILPQAFGMAVLPNVSRDFRHKGKDIAALRLATKLSLIGGGVLAALTTAYAPAVIVLCAGEAYAAAGRSLAVIAWALGPYSAVLILTSALNGMGGRREIALIGLSVVVLHAAGLVVLLPETGLAGASLSFALSAFLGCAASSYVVQRKAGSARFVWWLVPLALTALLGCTLFLLPQLASALAPAFAALLLLLSWRGGLFTGEERRLIAENILPRAWSQRSTQGSLG